MKKCYVLDTNVLLSDPNSIFSFGKNDVVIPSVVVEEIDSKKKLMDELGRNARETARILDGLREAGELHEGVQLPNKGIIKVSIHSSDSVVFSTFGEINNDNAIIAVAKTQSEINPNTILVSKDVIVRIKSDIVSVKAEDYKNDKISLLEDELYKGFSTIEVNDELVDKFYRDDVLIGNDDVFGIYPENHMFILKSNISNKKSAVCRKIGNQIVPLYNYTKDTNVFGIHHKNVEQLLALELLLDDSIPLVTLSGKAGTGKTLLTLAAALHKTLEQQKYTKILVARPIVPMGKDIGYLPGEKEEKLRPWMQPIYDNLEFLFDCKTEHELNKILLGYEKTIQVEALTYIRGRSIPNQFIIIDEAQNLTKHEVKTITTRIGEGSKVVLVGDPEQIDHPYLDLYSNGLSHVIEKMKTQKVSGHITLKQGERSTLAQLCADIL